MRADETAHSTFPLWLLCFAVLVRIASLGLYPLMDTSEARYAEIARKMAASGDWITPWFDSGVPFWGKPPLSFWLDALSFRLFGVGEFTARLPHWLTAMLILLLLWRWLAREFDRRVATVSCVLLMTSALFFITAGAVLTDTALALAAVLIMIGFWQGLHSPDRNAAAFVMLFSGIAIGLLAKGPIILVIAGAPLMAWILWQRKLAVAWQRFPWITGGLAAFLIAAAWYLPAEFKTPGFIDYFIVGEHWQRFLEPGWKGDMYGTAHDYPNGRIWLFLAQACFPWIFLLPLAALMERWRPSVLPSANWSSTNRPSANRLNAGLRDYLLLWGLWPAVFFTFAGNILWTYVLPGLPAFAALGGAWLVRSFGSRRMHITLAAGALGVIGLFLSLLLYLQINATTEAKTAKFLVQRYEQLRENLEPLVYIGHRPFSAEFYSRNQALLAGDAASAMKALKARGGRGFLAFKDRHYTSVFDLQTGTLDCVANFHATQLCHVSLNMSVEEPGKPDNLAISE